MDPANRRNHKLEVAVGRELALDSCLVGTLSARRNRKAVRPRFFRSCAYIQYSRPARIRHIIPVLIVVAIAWLKWRSRPVSQPPPVTGNQIHLVISDLTKIQELAPVHRNVTLPPFHVLLRVTAVLYIPYSILVFLIRLRVIIAVTGTVILTWKAPWAVTVRKGLWSSAWFRWSAYHLWSFISGQPLPPPPESYTITVKSNTKADPKMDATTVTPVEPVRFLFTIYENQRWWMGLDWTAALLPQERPAWSTSSEEPVSPPSAFILPPPTTVYLPHEKGRTKRTATWTWEEDEWRVLRKLEGSSTSRIERPLPSLKEEVPTNRLLKAAGMMKDAKDVNPSHEKKDEEKEEEHSQSDEMLTDIDGWIYADNKWEGGSGKGSMGKVCITRAPLHENLTLSHSTHGIGDGHG